MAAPLEMSPAGAEAIPETVTSGLSPQRIEGRSLGQIAWLQPDFVTRDGQVLLAIQALVVETPSSRIVIDTCVGNDRKGRGLPNWNDLQTSFLKDFAKAGFGRETIDIVFCTHMHPDHIGWNTMLQKGAWVPTFPKARYLVGRKEFEYWSSLRGIEQVEVVYKDSIEPIIRADLLEQIDLPFSLCPEISLVPTPGHTPGHASVQIKSAGESAMISGDFIHHPLQMAVPDISQRADSDPVVAVVTRRWQLGQLVDTGSLLIGTHFAPPTAGKVRADGDVFRFEV